jgi:DegV family protein with EDD domain
MGKIAIVTDSNSGITRRVAEEMGVYVLPMPFYINGELYLEDITLTQEEFYEHLKEKAEISTSMPAIGDVTDLWDSLLKTHDEIVYIPMSSGLSSSCETAVMLSQDYEGKVEVVNNRRISATQKQAVKDALALAEAGWSAAEIKKYLEDTQYDSTIYITLDTLYYLKKGGRITPAAAALGTLLRLKPVLQIQGEKLDAYAKSRTLKAAKATMLEAIEKDNRERFHGADDMSDATISLVYSGTDLTEINAWRDELKLKYPNQDLTPEPLSLSVSCHIGPGAVAITCCKNLPKGLLER